MILIESKDNNLFKETKKLKERKNRNKKNKFIIEGFRLVKEAFKAGIKIEYLMISVNAEEKFDEYFKDYITSETKIYEISEKLFNELASTETPQGIIAVADIGNKTIDLNKKFYLLCDKVQDPGNMGTIIRTAHAAGIDGIILTKGTVDIYNEKTIRSTMGSLFYVPVVYDDNEMSMLKELREKGFKIVTTSLEAENDFYNEDLKGKTVLVVGNEGNGVSDAVYNMSDIKVKIPMPGNAESLNVAVASSIIMYEKLRQDR